MPKIVEKKNTKKNKIKILHITQVSGGINTYLDQIFQNIDHSKFEMVLSAPLDRTSLLDTAKKHNVKWISINIKWQISPIADLKSIYQIIKIVKKEKPSLIHAHSSKAGMLCRIAGKFFKQKIFYTPNAYAYLGAEGLKRNMLLTFEKVARPLTDVLLAASNSEAWRAINEVRFKNGKVKVFPNSIEIPALTEKGPKEPTAIKTVTMVGRLVNQKNPIMFLEVCKLVTTIRKDIQFQIIGAGFDDQLKPEIDQFIEKNNLSINIVYWMDRPDLLKAIGGSDVFVMTSKFESFGYVAAEAQVLEIPVVTTNVDGLNEIVEDHETGFIVALGDITNMAEKIMYLIDNPIVAKEMGKKGRIRTSRLFDIKHNIKILENFYANYGC